LPAPAAELLNLRSGFTIEVQSHTLRNSTLIATTGTGTLEFPSADVLSIESVPDAPAANTSDSDLNPSGSSPSFATPLASDVPLAPTAALEQAARDQGLSPELVLSVAKIESGLNPSAVSPKGAVGLMQLMPATAASLKVAPEKPSENAAGGATYLRQLLLQYNGDAALALAAYNAGPGAVARYRGVPPYPETRRYIVRVLTELSKRQHPSK
jgi:hypothetical protein